jgi:hypothetical protein
MARERRNIEQEIRNCTIVDTVFACVGVINNKFIKADQNEPNTI